MTENRVPALRLFLALWPDDRIRDALVDAQRLWAWPAGAAPVPREKLHVTLHFLGSVPSTRFHALRPLLAVRGEPFDLTADQSRQHVWPGGIAVLELAAPPALRALHAALADVLRRQDFPVEDRPYRPHVTFARKAWGAKAPATAPSLAWHGDGGWSLVRSSPRDGYQVVEADALH